MPFWRLYQNFSFTHLLINLFQALPHTYQRVHILHLPACDCRLTLCLLYRLLYFQSLHQCLLCHDINAMIVDKHICGVQESTHSRTGLCALLGDHGNSAGCTSSWSARNSCQKSGSGILKVLTGRGPFDKVVVISKRCGFQSTRHRRSRLAKTRCLVVLVSYISIAYITSRDSPSGRRSDVLQFDGGLVGRA